MKEFLLMLFFAKIIALTPQPVDIVGVLEIRPAAPLKAITSGASIQIDVTHLIGRVNGVEERAYKLNQLFPAKSIEAELYSRENQQTKLRYDGTYAWESERAWLILSSESGVPTGVEFDRIVLRSQVPLSKVLVSWKNSSK